MSNMLQWGAAYLTSQLKRSAVAGETIVYRRGTEAVELVATLGRTEYEGTDQYGITVRLTSRDFLIDRDDFVLEGALATPEAGDLIDVIIGDNTETFEVMPLMSGGQCFSIEPQSLQLRIHAKQTEVA